MFPTSQSALPLPLSPDIERYRKIAKGLVKACKANTDSLENWAGHWVDDLVTLSGVQITPHLPVNIQQWKNGLADFAHRTLLGACPDPDKCNLAGAQFVIARSHGFENWPAFLGYLQERERNSPASSFEGAVDAIINGDTLTLREMLRADARLIHLRSTRSHHATVLHYISANGIEGYRQRIPANVLEIAEILLEAGAPIHATAEVYGHGCTTLELTATSGHPERAGVQEELLALLLRHGATIGDDLVTACLANGRLQAAQFLAGQGATLDLASAAGIGNFHQVTAFLHQSASALNLPQPLFLACQYGHNRIVELLIAHGAEIAAADPNGQTALHWAVIGGYPATVKLLLGHGPPLERQNSYGGTPFGQALWSAAHHGDPAAYVPVLQALADAGAELPHEPPSIHPAIDHWFAERAKTTSS